MTTRDIFTDLAAIRHPYTPDPDPEGATAAYDAWCEEIAEDRRRDAEALRLSCEQDGVADPLLASLRRAQRAKEDAEAEIRRLLAYGREFVRPRGYTLESLAKATGMSISGVRTAYWSVDVETVAKATGANPRDDRVYIYNPLVAEAGVTSLRWSPPAADAPTSETPPEQDAGARG